MDKPSQEQIEIMRQYWKSIYNKAAPILEYSKAASNIKLFIIVSALLASCTTDHFHDLEIIRSIPNEYHGNYVAIESDEGYKISIKGDGIYDITPPTYDADLGIDKADLLYKDIRWNKKKYGQPIVLCQDENCYQYLKLALRLEDKVLVIWPCNVDYPRSYTDYICTNPHTYKRY